MCMKVIRSASTRDSCPTSSEVYSAVQYCRSSRNCKSWTCFAAKHSIRPRAYSPGLSSSTGASQSMQYCFSSEGQHKFPSMRGQNLPGREEREYSTAQYYLVLTLELRIKLPCDCFSSESLAKVHRVPRQRSEAQYCTIYNGLPLRAFFFSEAERACH